MFMATWKSIRLGNTHNKHRSATLYSPTQAALGSLYYNSDVISGHVLVLYVREVVCT